MVNWEEMVPNKSVLDQVNIFHKTLMNVFSKDPLWLNEFVKNKKWKN